MKYFAWLEEELQKTDHTFDEFDGSMKVLEYRKNGSDLFIHPSFKTTSSFGSNGAIIHYKPEKETCLKLSNKEIYLLDSGGQYLDGTTDITRTVHFTEATDFQKDCYTRVLMGNLDVERSVWPKSAKYAGADFDYLARRHLMQVGLEFKHGTGHGIGCCLCVHEGPIGISRANKIPYEEGMVVSDEPGYYQSGEFGIRIENAIMVKTHPEMADHFHFENLTIAPYCRELLKTEIMPAELIEHVNAHHVKCLENLSPLLSDDSRALDYVQRQCEPIKL